MGKTRRNDWKFEISYNNIYDIKPKPKASVFFIPFKKTDNSEQKSPFRNIFN